jgi:two-component system, sensor histidine kinase and response regulator
MGLEMATILVVDDEPVVSRLCQTIMCRGGHEALAASGGAEALRILQDNADGIDLALIDVMMPVMNGIELARRIRQMRPTVRIVLMSGFSPREILPLVGSHPYRVIWKPFKSQSLLQMIENASDDSVTAQA